MIRIPQRLVKSGRGFASALSVLRRSVKAVTSCTNAVSARQKLVKQVGACRQHPKRPMKAGRDSVSPVRSYQRLVRGPICVL